MTTEEIAEFERLARPLIEWLNNNRHPHHTIVITPNSVELLEGVVSIPVHDYVRD